MPDLRDAGAAIAALHPLYRLETLTSGRLVVAYTGERPTEWVEDGRLVGVHGEVRRQVAELLGLEVVPVQMAWPDQIPALARGEIDLPGLGTEWTAERARRFAFTQPYQYYALGFVDRLADSPNRSGPATVRELAGRVGQLAGCANEAELASIVGPERLVLLRDFDELAAMVAERTLTGFFYDFPNAREALAHHPLGAALRLRALERDERYPLTTGRFPNYLMFRAETFNLRAAADLALDALKTHGVLREIGARYGFDRELDVIA